MMRLDDKSSRGNNGLKVAAFSLSLLVSAHLGDNLNINDRMIYPTIYRGRETAEYFAEEPFELEKRIILNDEGELETYFGRRDAEEFHRVRDNDHTARFIDDVIDGTREKAREIREYTKDNFFLYGIGEAIKYGMRTLFF